MRRLRDAEAAYHRIDTIRVGLARKFSIPIVHDPLGECALRGVTPEAMIAHAEQTYANGERRQWRQLALPLHG